MAKETRSDSTAEAGEALPPGCWDVSPDSVLGSNIAKSNDFQCNWLDFVSTTGKSAKMCCHGLEEKVSKAISTTKRFHHCDVLSRMWNESLDKTPNSVYVEIGANIGSCVMEMLLSTDAKIIAFEPHPHNQWALQNTIQNLDESHQRRFVLVPVALGKEPSKSKLYASASNMGNSVVGTVIKDTKREKTKDFREYHIHVERLSSILDVAKNDEAIIDIPLMKLDAQGFECQILEGIGHDLANLIGKIKFEVAPKWLKGQHCNDLFTKFRNLGFVLRREGQTTEVIDGDDYGGRMYEAVAYNKRSL